MRHIDKEQLVRYGDPTRINAARDLLDAVPAAQRSKYIKDNASDYTYLKDALWELGLGKCWYSEAILMRGEGQVEHFRPMRRLSGVKHSGYWWDAFDWSNLRLAHGLVNMRRTNPLTKEPVGKGSYFPLRENCPRATSRETEIAEHPLLLDPTVRSDCLLIVYRVEEGIPIPRISEETNRWKHTRAAESIKFYNLKDGTWNFKRKDLADRVSRLCDKLIIEFEEDPQSDAYDKLCNELSKHLNDHAEFSTIAWQVAREKGILEQFMH